MSYEEGSSVWILAEQENGEIHSVSYELLGKGKELSEKLNTELCSLLLTPDSKNAEELIYRGADKVYVMEDQNFDRPDETLYKENIERLVEKKEPEIILIGATNFGRSLAPRLAASLETGLTADCTGLEIDEEGNFVQIRPAFTGNILAHIYTDRSPKMSTVRYKEFEEAKRDKNREGEIITLKPIIEDNEKRSSIIEIIRPKEEINLENAEIVVSVGQGLKDPDDLELVKDLANSFEGVLGASRPLVDEGWISREHQVGYSGKRVKPRLYIACGISGAPQHLAGMKESDVIVAINTDPSAPIFNYADYGIVGDMYEIIPELVKQLSND